MFLERLKPLPLGKLSVALFVLLASAGSLPAQSGKVSKDLEKASGQVNVIVQFKRPLALDLHQRVAAHGGTLTRELGLVRSGVYKVPASEIPSLASDPEVAYISPDRPVAPTGSVGGDWVND